MYTKQILAEWVVDALRRRGGEAHHLQVARTIWEEHEDDLRASGDLFFTWQYDLRWAAFKLRGQGILQADDVTRRGVWALR